MRLAAGLPVVLAVAASVAGWWLLLGVGVAALLAFGTRWAVPQGRGGLLRGARIGTLLGVAVLAGSAFAAYAADVVPGHARWPGGLLVAGAAVAVAAGIRFTAYWRRWVLGVLCAAAVVFTSVCVAIAPAAHTAPGSPDAGVLASAAVLYPLLGGLRGVRLAAAAASAAVVAAAALYQLGPVRLGLSVTSLRDVLVAADARVLLPLLAAVVTVAAAGAAVAALAAVRDELPGRGRTGVLVPGLAAALGAVVLAPAGAVLLAALLALTEVLLTAGSALRGGRRLPAAAVAVLAAAMLAGMVLVR
ncbi:hypothetical protein B0I33_104312 [Prauserella shujinwangii]|uniref:Uncharacterized protein n=1 Tax=Prauserella shujinwangii TaxID=1453103 RepID=A0A2T0LWU2_9PSEU|nr:hypothetical protein [Prauserella shujinwangii]PRX48495.1 hypothetical protein B0I33_104312 [Prauserella shujinwangii]